MQYVMSKRYHTMDSWIPVSTFIGSNDDGCHNFFPEHA